MLPHCAATLVYRDVVEVASNLYASPCCKPGVDFHYQSRVFSGTIKNQVTAFPLISHNCRRKGRALACAGHFSLLNRLGVAAKGGKDGNRPCSSRVSLQLVTRQRTLSMQLLAVQCGFKAHTLSLLSSITDTPRDVLSIGTDRLLQFPAARGSSPRATSWVAAGSAGILGRRDLAPPVWTRRLAPCHHGVCKRRQATSQPPRSHAGCCYLRHARR